jgi:branched-chain amino acid transport system substrate-binding protein
MQTRRIGALVVAAMVVTGACSSAATTAPAAAAGSAAAPTASAAAPTASAAAPTASAAASGKTVTIGVDLPLSGGEFANGDPQEKGIKLAVDQANASGGVGGYTIKLNMKDDAVNGQHNVQQGASNVNTLAADPSVIGIVGPWNSNVAAAQIPITNTAGLLQCSPGTTNPSLTKPAYGALELRKANPTKINYVRVATTDDIQGFAGAEFAYTDLGKRGVYVVDDTGTYGKGLADVFVASFTKLGGTVVKVDGAPPTTTDYTPLLTAALALKPDYVYFGGNTPTGGGLLRKQMPQAGLGSIDFGGGDGIVDGTGDVKGSFISVVGAGAANSYGTIAGAHDMANAAAFAATYQKAYGEAPGIYSIYAYSCTQIILNALQNVASTATTPAALREAVRAYAVDPSNKVDTEMGSITFDSNGDVTSHFISFYKTDMTAASGKGDWVFVRQQDFASTGQ